MSNRGREQGDRGAGGRVAGKKEDCWEGTPPGAEEDWRAGWRTTWRSTETTPRPCQQGRGDHLPGVLLLLTAFIRSSSLPYPHLFPDLAHEVREGGTRD